MNYWNKLQQKRLEIRREYQNKPGLNYHAFLDDYPKEKILLKANNLMNDIQDQSNQFEDKMKLLEDKWRFSDYITHKS